MDIASLLYEQQIINQQISYFVLKEEYEDANGRVVTEGLHEAWEWIKDKVNKFIGVLKSWFGKIWTFLTKTFPAAIKKMVDGILEVLHLKKKAEIIDESKIKEGDKAKIEEICDKANKANAVIVAAEKSGTEAAPTISVPTNTGEKKEDNGSDNKKTEISQKELLAQAVATKTNAVDSLEEIAKTAPAEEKAELTKTVTNIKSKKQVVMSSKQSTYLQGPLLDLDKAENYMKCSRKAVSMLYDDITKRAVFDFVASNIKRSSIDKEISKTNPNANSNKIMNAKEIEYDMKQHGTNLTESIQKPVKSYTDCKKETGAYKYSNYGKKKIQKIQQDELEKRAKQIVLSSSDKQMLNMLKNTFDDALANLQYVSKNLNSNLSKEANSAIESYISFVSKCSTQFTIAINDITGASKGIATDIKKFTYSARHVK